MSVLKRALLVAAVAAAGLLASAVPASAQVEPCPAPAKQPPAGSPKLLRCIQLVFHPDGISSIGAENYLYYMKRTSGSDSTRDYWVPYDEQEILDDFDRLVKTGFLDDLWVERIDEPYENGTPAEHIIYHMEERPRLKVIDYTGSKEVEISKIEEALKNANITLKFDTFLDESVIKKVTATIKDLYSERGYNDATVEVERQPMPGGPKLLRLTFNIKEGPKFRLVDVAFDGNKAFSDKELAGQLKANRPHNWLSFISGSGQYQESKFEEDAQRLNDFYSDHGYAQARVGAPQVERLRDSPDGKVREVRLRVPVDEGERYKVGKIDISGNTAIKTDYLRPLFKVPDENQPFHFPWWYVFVRPFHKIDDPRYYSKKRILKGYDKAKEIYGASIRKPASPSARPRRRTSWISRCG